MASSSPSSWDLTALLNAADAGAPLPARNLWLVRLLEWLRHPVARTDEGGAEPSGRPLPLLRLTHLLNVLERHPEHARPVAQLLLAIWREMHAVGLFADVGFAPRMALWSELLNRLRLRVLPGTVDTQELAELFVLLFPEPEDAQWLSQLDAALLQRLAALLAQAEGSGHSWREPMQAGLTALISAVRSAGLSGALRQRMDAALLQNQPFTQLASTAEQLLAAQAAGDSALLHQRLQLLRALLDDCRSAAASVPRHLEQHGVSVDIVFEVEQMQARIRRIEALLDCLVAPEPQRELARLLAELARVTQERRSLRTLFARHYSLLARKVTERSAETGEHYITRTRSEYRAMLLSAAGGGALMAITTFVKFGIAALAFPAFWAGFWAGANYAASFVAVQLMHWTVATKQPAMTAPALAQKLGSLSGEKGLEEFVDEVAHLLRSQMAGIVGNLCAVIPLVLAVQLLSAWLLGTPLVGAPQADYVLHSLTLLGPTLAFAAFTGVLLFSSSLIAGWAENWFVLYRLDAAIAWNPRLVARLGQPRAQRWADWWRHNISGLAANVSLGMMLGLLPALAAFFGLPIEVRHVTLSTGQIAAAAGALGLEVLHQPGFWWCVAAIPLTGLLNVGVSFYLAFKLALRSKGLQVADRARLRRAIWQRLREQPRSFLLPPR
ncbi:site-specific recombinase [Roseateles sp.]|jgi:site-specific recombinase|uniref:site-specific recombinase n=1 Tax=Roseateles sp. TaxID=1971397 RepID=UPI0037C946F9